MVYIVTRSSDAIHRLRRESHVDPNAASTIYGNSPDERMSLTVAPWRPLAVELVYAEVGSNRSGDPTGADTSVQLATESQTGFISQHVSRPTTPNPLPRLVTTAGFGPTGLTSQSIEGHRGDSLPSANNSTANLLHRSGMAEENGEEGRWGRAQALARSASKMSMGNDTLRRGISFVASRQEAMMESFLGRVSRSTSIVDVVDNTDHMEFTTETSEMFHALQTECGPHKKRRPAPRPLTTTNSTTSGSSPAMTLWSPPTAFVSPHKVASAAPRMTFVIESQEVDARWGLEQEEQKTLNSIRAAEVAAALERHRHQQAGRKAAGEQAVEAALSSWCSQLETEERRWQEKQRKDATIDMAKLAIQFSSSLANAEATMAAEIEAKHRQSLMAQRRSAPSPS